MKFQVVGANRDTGQDVSLIIDAVTPSAAEEQAKSMNILIERIDLVSPAVPVPAHAEPMPAATEPAIDKSKAAEHVLLVRNRSFRGDPGMFVLAILLIALWGAGLVILLLLWIACKTTVLVVTDRRTTLKHGLIARHTSEVMHRDIRNVQVHQGVLQRIFGSGNLLISSAAQGDIEIKAIGILAPETVKKMIDQYRE